ncbi:hypothetical protein [Salinigranum rubrum]|uniref:hypothetical protein n=1 Tax=Salinigranum rubrum TaxID=755307 RepID=UPI0013A5BD92|nr:hypothetical protein [Salinigranum rubrum]
MNPADATVFWIETGAMQGEKRYILEVAEHLAEFFDERGRKDGTIAIGHQGTVWPSQEFKPHDSDHYSPQWRIFLPRAFSQFSPTYYPNKVARFEKDTTDGQWYTGPYYDLVLRNPSHTDVDRWRKNTESQGFRDFTGQGDTGREFGYY